MIHLDLTKEERNVLRGVLEYDLSELHRELADTDNWKFKAALKDKDKVLRKILEALEEAQDEVEVKDDVIL